MARTADVDAHGRFLFSVLQVALDQFGAWPSSSNDVRVALQRTFGAKMTPAAVKKRLQRLRQSTRGYSYSARGRRWFDVGNTVTTATEANLAYGLLYLSQQPRTPMTWATVSRFWRLLGFDEHELVLARASLARGRPPYLRVAAGNDGQLRVFPTRRLRLEREYVRLLSDEASIVRAVGATLSAVTRVGVPDA